MSLQRPLPVDIQRAMTLKAAQAGAPMNRQSRQSGLSLAIRSRYFQIAASQELQLSPAWMRGFLLVQNNSLNPMYLDFDKPASLQSYLLASGQQFSPLNIAPCTSISVFSLFDCEGIIIEG